MYKFKTKLLYNEEEYFYTKTDSLKPKRILPFSKLVIVQARLQSDGLIFSGNTPVDI